MESRARGLAVPLAAAVLGFLAVMAAVQPRTASRAIRRLEIADLIRQEDARVRGLREELRAAEREIETLEDQAASTNQGLGELEGRVGELGDAAGATPVEGEGAIVTLDDSSASRSPTGNPNDLVVHERDIQAVVNALWGAGAEAVSVNGDRLSSASAVRCAGNTLILHGTLHSPPYRIAGIGDAEEIAQALPAQPGMGRLAAAVEAFGLGYSVDTGTVRMSAPPVPDVTKAEPA